MDRGVIIIGGGLAGLTAAYELKKQGVKALILEASNRIGGRIYTKKIDGVVFELGATWVFQDMMLKHLIEELKLSIYPQYLSGNALIKYDPSIGIQQSPTKSLMNGAVYHKVEGGTGAIIQALSDRLDPNDIMLNSKVASISYHDDKVSLLLATDGKQFDASHIIIAMPPKVIADQIKVTPALNNHDIMDMTHTWMGDSIKFTVVFDQDYWRNRNQSGFVYSNYGLIREMQDHTSLSNNTFALVGFMQPSGELWFDFDKRKQTVIGELKELFGIREENVLAYDDFLWSDHFIDGQGQNHNTDMMPHQNNGHSSYLTSHFAGRLFFAGAETSPQNPGYMEGAVNSAYRAVDLLLAEIESTRC